MGTGRVIASFGAFILCIAFVVGALAVPRAEANGARNVAATILEQHNRERARFGLARLSWSGKLAREAQVWADELARSNTMRHSTRAQRGGAGENLWAGSAGYYSPAQMIDGFLQERRMFRAGNFPDVSTTGQWSDVGHYTQIIWPQTREVGCAIARGQGNDFLVCRYMPAGNVYGQPVG